MRFFIALTDNRDGWVDVENGKIVGGSPRFCRKIRATLHWLLRYYRRRGQYVNHYAIQSQETEK